MKLLLVHPVIQTLLSDVYYQHTATPKMEILHFDIVAVVMCQVYYAVSFTLESRADTRFRQIKSSVLLAFLFNWLLSCWLFMVEEECPISLPLEILYKLSCFRSWFTCTMKHCVISFAATGKALQTPQLILLLLPALILINISDVLPLAAIHHSGMSYLFFQNAAGSLNVIWDVILI